MLINTPSSGRGGGGGAAGPGGPRRSPISHKNVWISMGLVTNEECGGISNSCGDYSGPSVLLPESSGDFSNSSGEFPDSSGELSELYGKVSESNGEFPRLS